jgi:hypothetical protein
LFQTEEAPFAGASSVWGELFLLSIQQVYDVCDEVGEGIVDDDVAIVVAHVVSGRRRRQLAVYLRWQGCDVRDVRKGKESADDEAGAVEAIDAQKAAPVIVMEIRAIVGTEVIGRAILRRPSPVGWTSATGTIAWAGATGGRTARGRTARLRTIISIAGVRPRWRVAGIGAARLRAVVIAASGAWAIVVTAAGAWAITSAGAGTVASAGAGALTLRGPRLRSFILLRLRACGIRDWQDKENEGAKDR